MLTVVITKIHIYLIIIFRKFQPPILIIIMVYMAVCLHSHKPALPHFNNNQLVADKADHLFIGYIYAIEGWRRQRGERKEWACLAGYLSCWTAGSRPGVADDDKSIGGSFGSTWRVVVTHHSYQSICYYTRGQFHRAAKQRIIFATSQTTLILHANLAGNQDNLLSKYFW